MFGFFLRAENYEFAITSYTVACVEIKFKKNKVIKGYIPVYETGERGKLKLDPGQDILAVVNTGKPIIFTDKYYEIPGVDKAFSSAKIKHLNAADISEIKFLGWEDFTGIISVYILPEAQIKTAIKMIKKGAKPIICEEHEIKYSFIPINGRISDDELETFVSYWMKYRIKQPVNLFCYPVCDGLPGCEEVLDKFGEDLVQTEELLKKLSYKRVINVPDAAYPVYERINYFSGLLEFYTAVNTYWVNSDPYPLLKCIKTRYPDAASMEREILDNKDFVCEKINVIRKAFYTCGIERRNRQPYGMFIDADKKMIERGYYIRLSRQLRDA